MRLARPAPTAFTCVAVVLAGTACAPLGEVVGGFLLAEHRPEVRRISVEVTQGARGLDFRAGSPIERIACNEHPECRGVPGEQTWNARCAQSEGCPRQITYGDGTVLSSLSPARPLRAGACYLCWVWGPTPEFGTVQFCVGEEGRVAACPQANLRGSSPGIAALSHPLRTSPP